MRPQAFGPPLPLTPCKQNSDAVGSCSELLCTCSCSSGHPQAPGSSIYSAFVLKWPAQAAAAPAVAPEAATGAPGTPCDPVPPLPAALRCTRWMKVRTLLRRVDR